MPAPGTDTAPSAAAIQFQVLRRLPPTRRLALAIEMSLAARALLTARLRAEHSDWSEAELRRECLRLASAEAAPSPPHE